MSEGVTDARRDESGITVTLWSAPIRYVVPVQTDAGEERLEVILRRSADSGRSVKLSFDSTRGQIDREAKAVVFPLCQVSIDDLTFTPEQTCRPAVVAPEPTGATALALGIAQLTAGDMGRAAWLLDHADASDDAVFRTLLLRARADLSASLAADAEAWSETADRLNVKAVRDYRALAALAPDDMDAQTSLGTVLEELGAYAEARAHFDRLLASYPEEEYRLRVRIGAVYRREGDLRLALDQLDRIAAAEGGEPTGMKYHYHRGWTLTRLGRYDDAVAEFDKGIVQQPDYSWAYLRRACAQASLGRPKEALANAGHAASLMTARPDTTMFRSTRFNLERTRAVVAELTRAVAENDRSPRPTICAGYWDRAEESRPRSRLLGAG